MAVERERECGYRKVGGMYLVGGILDAPCDRLPIELVVCKVCGQGQRVGKGFTKFDPYELWGVHEKCKDSKGCYCCYPPHLGYMMRVGSGFYNMETFIHEARQMGVSKRIPFIPRELVVGLTPIYLVHKEAIVKYPNWMDKKNTNQEVTISDGVFAAFIPQRIETLMWQSELATEWGEKRAERLEKRGVTIIPIPDGDEDHA